MSDSLWRLRGKLKTAPISILQLQLHSLTEHYCQQCPISEDHDHAHVEHSVADLHSKILDARPPGPNSNSFNFMQLLGKFAKILCWRPPGGLAPLPRGNRGSAAALPSDLHQDTTAAGSDPNVYPKIL